MEIEKTRFAEIHNMLSTSGYEIIKSIGKGAFGEVLQVKNSNECQFAVKVISKQLLRSKPFLRKYINQQIEIMKKLNHSNIVRLLGSNQSNDFIILIMEYCKEGNLLSYQASLQRKCFSPQSAVYVISQILKGLKFIHEQEFIHRDIKSENILMKLEKQGNQFLYRYKIADFGFARPIGKIGAKTHCGTEKYMAPEIISNEPYGILVDMWALAVLFYFMLFTEYPFHGHDMKSDIVKKCCPYFNVSSTLIKKQKAKTISPQIIDFFKKVFVVDQRKRLTFSKILLHPIFLPYKDQKDFNDYEQVYLGLEKKQKFIKDEISKIPEQFESEAEPEDESRTLLLRKVKQFRNQYINPELALYLEELHFQIKKVLYLKECATQMFENYSTYLTYSERLGAKFYFLRAFLFFCDPLLKRLQSKLPPEGFKQISITPQIWNQCTLTQEYKKIILKLQDQHLKNLFAFEDTYELLQSIVSQIQINGFEKGFSSQINEKDFNQFKLGYRSMTVHLFRTIQNCKNINKHLQHKIKLRIFCCHMINRIFMRANIQRNFPFFIEWLKRKKINYQHSFDFNLFKRWILEESAQNLEGNINVLHKNL